MDRSGRVVMSDTIGPRVLLFGPSDKPVAGHSWGTLKARYR